MVSLVTLEEASDHLRRDSGDDDGDLALKIEAASDAVLDYLQVDGLDWLDSDGYCHAPARVKQATLLLLGEFYRNRDGEQSGAVDAQYGYGYLPRPVVALLYSLRSPVMS